MPLLEVKKLNAGYGDFQALFDVSFEIEQGETVAIIGANGAGKSTFLGAITGLLPTSGQHLVFNSAAIDTLPAYERLKAGIAMVPEGRRLFPSLSVEENLLVGAHAGRRGHWNIETVYQLFPEIRERRHHGGTALSGGQQQMVAIGRALMSNPTLLLCDEISLGLAPKVIKNIYDSIPLIHDAGTTLIVVEQDINQALAVADRVYCLQEGQVSLEGPADGLSKEKIAEAYFGISGAAA